MKLSTPTLASYRAGTRTAILGIVLSWVLWAQGAQRFHPDVDAFNLRVGTQTFAGKYQFTTNSLLVETALAIREMESDILKFYLGRDLRRQYGTTLPPGIDNLTALVRDEPSCRRVLDLPFRHILVWAYCFSPGGDAYWTDGMSAVERQHEYAEFRAFASHLLTTYSGSGKSFYLGHWEGDWYLLPGYATTNNPSPTALQGMRDWLNTRQQAVDDARRNTPHTNVNLYAYAEVNRVRDAMLNGPDSNQRLVNQVLPAVTNLDFVSWSAYDGQNLDAPELHRTLDYIESHLATNKSASIPGRRVFIGEYGWGGGCSTAEQEPRTREFIRNALGWGVRFVLFWQMYNNEPGRSYCLVDTDGQPTPCYHLHARFLKQARSEVARFHQDHRRLPDDAEFAALTAPLLNNALPEGSSAGLGDLEIAIRPGSEAGALNVRSPHCPGDLFDFRTCEGVVVGSTDLGLFQVKLPATFGDGHRSWRRDGNTWSYVWPYAQGITVRVAVEPDADSLKLHYTLQNTGTQAFDAVQLHTCIPTTEAPGFFPPPTVRQAETHWSELYQRLHLWSDGRRFTLADTTLAGREPHLSLMRQGTAPVRWAWWVNGPETFDLPLIALTSRDGHQTIALAFEQAVWASANTGDDRACFHLFPWFGRIEPGQSASVHGRFYLLRGGPEAALARFRQDFPGDATVNWSRSGDRMAPASPSPSVPR